MRYTTKDMIACAWFMCAIEQHGVDLAEKGCTERASTAFDYTNGSTIMRNLKLATPYYIYNTDFVVPPVPEWCTTPKAVAFLAKIVQVFDDPNYHDTCFHDTRMAFLDYWVNDTIDNNAIAALMKLADKQSMPA